MPEAPLPNPAKKRSTAPPDGAPTPRLALPEVFAPGAAPAWAELQVRTNFTFLDGASHPDELVARAAALGLPALAITDDCSLAGVVRAHVAAKAAGVQLVIGASFRLDDVGDGARLLLHARSRRGYGRLARLVTVARRRADREAGASSSAYSLGLEDVLELGDGHDGWLATLVSGEELPTIAPDGRGGVSPSRSITQALSRLRGAFGQRLSLGCALRRGPNDAAELEAARQLARDAGVPLLATGDAAMHEPPRRWLRAVLACIREGTTLAAAGLRLPPNGEAALQDPTELAARFAKAPDAITRSVELASWCDFSLDELRYEYPEEVVPPGETATSYLRGLTLAGASTRYPDGVPAKVRGQLEHELTLVAELGYEPYFLTVHEIVRFARSRGILCQGRGSAANSAVCYCLGITSVDPARTEVLFERFVSRSRHEPPDIDVDFEHERREEVLQHVYSTYGRDRAAIAAEVITYRGRSAVREVGKALGLSLDTVDRLSGALDWGGAPPTDPGRLREVGLDPGSRTARLLLALTLEIQGFPRHLSQHVGGFVISRGPLVELVPVRNSAMPGRTFIEWDKDDLDALGLLKVDCLALGMLTCIRKTLDHISAAAQPLEPAPDQAVSTPEQRTRAEPLGLVKELAAIPAEDEAVYDMLCRADTVGVFQIESRAQMAMLPRLRPRCFYDLVVEVSIVRPGPIQGGIVHPYLRRRRGQEEVIRICPEVDEVLRKTLGVPVFQEQAMRLAIDAAGFTPDEADALRKAMGAWRRPGTIEAFRVRFCKGIEARGVTTEVAAQLFERLRGFGEYGFPESHAASFALLVYASAWLKRYHPAAFTAGLLDAQPMGFYAPAQLVADARAHGVQVLAPCVQESGWDSRLVARSGEGRAGKGLPRRPGAGDTPCVAEDGGRSRGDAGAPEARPEAAWGASGPMLRLGLRQVHGLGERYGRAIERARALGPFRSPGDLARRASLPRDALERLAEADALRAFGLHRRDALFDALGRRGPLPPLFDGTDDPAVVAGLPAPTPLEAVLDDYASLGLSLRSHPVAHVRDALTELGARPSSWLREAGDGSSAAVAGLVICRQRPQTAKGIYFFTLEDEAGVANVIVRPEVYERHRRAAREARCLLVAGTVEREGEVVHLLARRLTSADEVFQERRVASRSRDFR